MIMNKNKTAMAPIYTIIIRAQVKPSEYWWKIRPLATKNVAISHRIALTGLREVIARIAVAIGTSIM